jgi:hypothetical protein
MDSAKLVVIEIQLVWQPAVKAPDVKRVHMATVLKGLDPQAYIKPKISKLCKSYTTLQICLTGANKLHKSLSLNNTFFSPNKYNSTMLLLFHSSAHM